ncbi:hypothetical protein RGUI_2122 [Rhodovulum sp. P5]|nr:hypothetical protein RGUI_2122 [Rhodovulum sp. P5]
MNLAKMAPNPNSTATVATGEITGHSTADKHPELQCPSGDRL